MSSSEYQKFQHQQAWIKESDPEIRIHYVETNPSSGTTPKGTILLIHGFPETSYQFRHVMPLISSHGYRVIAPDYRGAGASSKPPSSEDAFTKTTIASDLHTLITSPSHLNITTPIHVIGHDIGGMIAHTYAAQYPEDTASVIWGECPLPGTKFYHDSKHTAPLWHFNFHSQGDIAESLVAGRERLYLKSFYDRLAQNPSAISSEDLGVYTDAYAQPGSIRCAFATYAAFERDAEINVQKVKEEGKGKVRSLVLNGERSFLAQKQGEMANEMYEGPEEAIVERSGHWIAEENPGDFVKKVVAFIEKKK